VEKQSEELRKESIIGLLRGQRARIAVETPLSAKRLVLRRAIAALPYAVCRRAAALRKNKESGQFARSL